MEYSNKINIPRFLDALHDQKYCIVKLDPNFPNYTAYSDIDIYCYDLDRCVSLILSTGKEYVEQGWEIKTKSSSQDHIHIDFYEKGAGKLDFRFDLYGALPHYRRVGIKPGFFSSVIENAALSGNLGVYLPSQIDDAILRYIEFIEWFDIRADKIKHTDYILNKVPEEEMGAFLDKLHYYTAIPETLADEAAGKRKFKRENRWKKKLNKLRNKLLKKK